MNVLYILIGVIFFLFMILYLYIDFVVWNLGLLGYNGVFCVIVLGDKIGIGVVKVIFFIILFIVL